MGIALVKAIAHLAGCDFALDGEVMGAVGQQIDLYEGGVVVEIEGTCQGKDA